MILRWYDYFEIMSSHSPGQLVVSMKGYLLNWIAFPFIAEIRNAITAARQLAMFCKKFVDSDSLKPFIDGSGTFEKCLKNVCER